MITTREEALFALNTMLILKERGAIREATFSPQVWGLLAEALTSVEIEQAKRLLTSN